MKKGSVSEMLHGSVGTWLNGVKTNARSRGKNKCGRWLIIHLRNAVGAKRILTVHCCLVCVIVVRNAMHVPNLRFLVIFMLCACPFVIFNGFSDQPTLWCKR